MVHFQVIRAVKIFCVFFLTHLFVSCHQSDRTEQNFLILPMPDYEEAYSTLLTGLSHSSAPPVSPPLIKQAQIPLSYDSGLSVGAWYNILKVGNLEACTASAIRQTGSPCQSFLKFLGLDTFLPLNYNKFDLTNIDYMVPSNLSEGPNYLEDTVNGGKSTELGNAILDFKSQNPTARLYTQFSDIYVYGMVVFDCDQSKKVCIAFKNQSKIDEFISFFQNNQSTFFTYFDGIVIDFEPPFGIINLDVVVDVFVEWINALQALTNPNTHLPLDVRMYDTSPVFVPAVYDIAHSLSRTFDGYQLSDVVDHTTSPPTNFRYKSEVLLYPRLLEQYYFPPFDPALIIRQQYPVSQGGYPDYGVWWSYNVWPVFFQSLIFATKFVDVDPGTQSNVTLLSATRAIVAQTNGYELYSRKISTLSDENNPLIVVENQCEECDFTSGAVFGMQFKIPLSAFENGKYKFEIWSRYSQIDFTPIFTKIILGLNNATALDDQFAYFGVPGNFEFVDRREPCYPIDYLDINHVNSIKIERGGSLISAICKIYLN